MYITYNSILLKLKNNIDVSCSMIKSKVTVLVTGADIYSPLSTNWLDTRRVPSNGGVTEMTSQENKHLGGTPQNS